jgi:inner membrane protein
MLICCRRGVPGITRLVLGAYLFLATASHGFLDALTNGGLGVAFFAPFNNNRYFFPWRPIQVSPISLGKFLSQRGYLVLKSELLWIWLPTALVATIALTMRATTTNREDKSAPL